MLALFIEVGGLLGVLVGGGMFARSHRGAKRLWAVGPLLLYSVGQAIPPLMADVDSFAQIYPWALALMAVAGAAGLVLLFKSRTPLEIDP